MPRIAFEIAFSGMPSRQASFHKDEIRIGRAPQCDIVLDHDQISRTHCRIVFKDKCWRMTDSNSANGVYLDRGGRGAPFLSRHDVLVHGDHLYLGRFRVTILTENLDGEAAKALNTDEPIHGTAQEQTVLVRRDNIREDVRSMADQVRRTTPPPATQAK